MILCMSVDGSLQHIQYMSDDGSLQHIYVR